MIKNFLAQTRIKVLLMILIIIITYYEFLLFIFLGNQKSNIANVSALLIIAMWGLLLSYFIPKLIKLKQTNKNKNETNN